MLSDKRLDDLAQMNRMVIPQQHNRPANPTQQAPEPGDDLFPAYRLKPSLDHQLDDPPPRTDPQAAHQIEPFMMMQTGAHRWRLPTRRPGALELRNQGKTS